MIIKEVALELVLSLVAVLLSAIAVHIALRGEKNIHMKSLLKRLEDVEIHSLQTAASLKSLMEKLQKPPEKTAKTRTKSDSKE